VGKVIWPNAPDYSGNVAETVTAAEFNDRNVRALHELRRCVPCWTASANTQVGQIVTKKTLDDNTYVTPKDVKTYETDRVSILDRTPRDAAGKAIELSRKLLVEAGVIPDDGAAMNLVTMADEIIALLRNETGAPAGDHALVVEYLRQVWNARGAADAQAIESRYASLAGWGTTEPYRNQLRDAIKGLDR
jgi:hypothetical protein